MWKRGDGGNWIYIQIGWISLHTMSEWEFASFETPPRIISYLKWEVLLISAGPSINLSFFLVSLLLSWTSDNSFILWSVKQGLVIQEGICNDEPLVIFFVCHSSIFSPSCKGVIEPDFIHFGSFYCTLIWHSYTKRIVPC